MVRKILFLFIGIFLISLSFISAWDFYGHVKDVNGTALYNATINITFWTMGGAPTLVGSNASYSNETGGFNFDVHKNSSYFYKPVIRHFEQNRTNGTTPIDYVGQSLPWFPFGEFEDTTDINFYLREAGTINITAVNATGSAKKFYYQVKDTKLGYPIDGDFDNYISQKTVYVPIDRNYSVMIYPNESMPVSFDWNNFSATNSYNISTPSNNINLSSYNHTTHTLHKQFNVTENLVWVSGHALNSTGGIDDYDEFTVVPFILEPGNMVYLGDDASMPYNMSAWRGDGATDNYSLSTGFYNITLSGSAEAVDYILFATARNGTDYYGGYRNISLNYTDTDRLINFTMHELIGADWNTSESNITMNDAGNWSRQINISSAKQSFSLVNATTNETLGHVDAHIEVIVDYSDYNCTEFTFMDDLSNEDGDFYLPLIRAIGVKEMNIYSNNYAPRRVGTMTVAEILANDNITMASWNPRDIDGALDSENIFIEFYTSSSNCDVPNPEDGCKLGGFGPDESQGRDNFSPLSVIIGGGKLSFRMGYGGIKIHYVNVDMLASGPPDIAFDSAATESRPSGGSFSSALRFGSMGPTIYDYVLVSIPYTEGSTSVAGLNESQEVKMSLPLFYTGDDVDTLIWDTDTNGTNGTLLAGNHSHYSAYSSEWETLMGDNTCITNVSNFNATNPCYIDTTNDRIWIRIPHFDGNEPAISGSSTTVPTAADDTTEDTGGGNGVVEVKETHSWIKITPGVAVIMKDFDKDIGIKQIQIEVHTEAQDVKITVKKYSSKPVNVSVEKSGKVHQYLQIETENLEDKLDKAIITIRVNKSWVSSNNLNENNITMFKFSESEEEWEELTTTYTESDDDYYYYDVEVTSLSYFAIGEKVVEEEEEEEAEEKDLTWLWIVIVAVVLAAIIGGGIAAKRREQ